VAVGEKVNFPVLVGVESHSAKGITHPVFDEPDGAGWHEWMPPAGDWTPIEFQSSDSSITAELTGAPAYIRAVFERSEGERFWGFGERSNAVEHSGSIVEHWVGEGPYQLADYQLVEAITPRWAIRRRRDATPYPIPWLLSSRGYGVLTECDEWSCHDLRAESTWTVIALTNRFSLRIFAAGSPGAALAMFSEETGRQPIPASEWFLGPWVGTAVGDSVVGTAVLPTRTHEIPHRDRERGQAVDLHGRGLKSMTRLSPVITRVSGELFASAARKRLFESSDGRAITFTAYRDGREPPFIEQAQLDFTNRSSVEFYQRLVEEALEDGHDGWIEEAGEFSPLLAEHNSYPLRYHRALAAIARELGRSPARAVGSGWSRSAAFSPLVLGSDTGPSAGFDGLRSALNQGLSAGLSGIAFWGAQTPSDDPIAPQLLVRWIQLAALSPLMLMPGGKGTMRQALPHWRRWAAFHKLLVPYLMAAAGEYVRTGMPIMRHHALTDPGDEVLIRLDDQYMLGPDLLVAPVLQPGARKRSIRLPAGEWLDLWRSVSVADDGSLHPKSPVVLRGGRSVMFPAPLKEIPVLVRAGGKVPGLDVPG